MKEWNISAKHIRNQPMRENSNNANSLIRNVMSNENNNIMNNINNNNVIIIMK